MPADRPLTLRQIEIVRAIMLAGSIGGAARLLNVAQPGVSRALKHIESLLRIRLFTREGGRYIPSPEAREVFSRMQEVHKKLEDLQFSISSLERGSQVELSVGSVPSIAHRMVPRAVARLKHIYPDIRVNIEVLRIEEAIDFLMLGRGELVCVSGRFEYPSIDFRPLAPGTLACIAHPSHALARMRSVSAEEIARYPLIGIDPKDPHGRIIVDLFERRGIEHTTTIRARFGSTVVELVGENLGVAVLDSYTLAGMAREGARVSVVPIREDTVFETYVAVRRDKPLSSFAERFAMLLRNEMRELNRPAP